MSDDHSEQPEADPFSVRAPIPRIVRVCVALIGLFSFIVFILSGIGLIEVSRDLAIAVLIGMPASVAGSVAIMAADRWAWRRSPHFKPGLRERRTKEAIARSPLLRAITRYTAFTDRSSGWNWRLNLVAGLIILVLLMVMGVMEWLSTI